MQVLEPLEPGVILWAGRDSLDEIRSLGVRCGQLAIPGDMPLTPAAVEEWKAAVARTDFTLVTVFAAYDGESYADAATVQRTVGFIPPATRAEREQRTFAISDFAAALGVASIACHIGFVPHDSSDPEYIAVREVVRRVCDHAARHGQTFALETGQEPAAILLAFIRDVNRPNLRINFDPANMILYGTGDPVEALRALGEYVVSVHAKDGDWPDPKSSRGLGAEKPLGQGAVGMERFVSTLADIGFRGPLNVEREVEDQSQRLREIKGGIELLQKINRQK
jgi:sugar phosphate isomerase/epimerase